jgi:hypothetical protein
MFKRLLVIVALAAALVACAPAAGESGAPVDPSMAVPSDAVPSESMGTESAAPSAS